MVAKSGAAVFVAGGAFDWIAGVGAVVDCGGVFVLQPAAKRRARVQMKWRGEVRGRQIRFQFIYERDEKYQRDLKQET